MEMNEKRQKAINEMEWRRLKKEFDELQTYPEKLAWWEINIPPRYQYIKNVISMPEFQYSGIGAPIVKDLPCAIIVKQFDTIKIDTSGSLDRQEFISILPKLFDSIEKKQFLDWLSVKINLKSSEHFESHYNEIFRNILPINRNEVIENLKNELNLERDEHKNHFDFKYGREYSMYDDPKYLKFGNPNIYFMGIEGSIKRIILGYQNNLKEIALDKVIKSLKDKTEILEPKTNRTGKNLTDPQKAILIFYLLNEIKNDLGAVKHYTLMADLTDNKPTNTKQYYDSDFNNLFYTKTGNVRNEDLTFVRDYLINMGLNNISEKVQNQFDKINNKKK